MRSRTCGRKKAPHGILAGVTLARLPILGLPIFGLPILSLSSFGLSTGQAHAAEFNLGEIQIFVDNTASYGASWRIQDRDCTNVNPVNGGCYFGPKLPDFGLAIPGGGVNAFGDPIPAGGLRTGTRSANTDDGTLNFDRGDLVNSTWRLSTDFEARWRDFSLFVRTLAFYDSVYDRNNLAFRDVRDEAQDDLASELFLRDAFVTGNFDVGDMPLTVRVGNQVINWGESLFIQGGINSYLPVDVSRLRAPGSEVKDGLLPVPAAFASLGVLPGLDIQAFYQWEHVETEIDPAQSYYSVADFAGAGGGFIVFGGPDDPNTSPVVQQRFADRGQDDGAWGVGATYFADWLNQGTELRAYYVQFSSTLPYLTFRAPGLNFEQICDSLVGNPLPALNIPDGYDGGPQSCVADPLNQAPKAFTVSASISEYGFDFPDDIEIFGFSFNTELFGSALSGEFAFWPDMPLALTDSEINARIIDSDTSSGPTAGELIRAPLLLQAYQIYGGAGAIPAGLAAVASETGRPFAVGSSSRGAGQVFEAFEQQDAITGQVASISNFAGSHWLASGLGADNTTVILNGGFMWVPNMPGLDETVIAAPGCEVGHPELTTSLTLASGSSAKTDLKCATPFSAGYRAVVTTSYANVANIPLTVSPGVALRKDFHGRSPGPYGPGFVAGQGSVALSMTFDYKNRWRAQAQYLNFFGAGFRNTRSDRDTVSATLSYSF